MLLDIVKLFPIRNVQEVQLLIASGFQRYMVPADSDVFVMSILPLVKGVVNSNLLLFLVSLHSSFITLLILPLFISVYCVFI